MINACDDRDVSDIVYALVDTVLFFVILGWFRLISTNYTTWQSKGEISIGEGLILLMISAMGLIYSIKPFVRGMSTIMYVVLSIFIKTDTGKKLVEYLKKKYPPSEVSSDITTEE